MSTETTTMVGLARELASLRDRKETLDADMKALASQIENVARELADAMLAEDVQRFTVDDRTFFTAVAAFSRVIDEERLLAFLREHGEGGMIRETVHPSTFRAWWKTTGQPCFEEELKAGIVEAFEKVEVRVRRN